eukprot:TRINITY_DN26645_c1_g2_i1.p1 TRINITY_DN26645_c1_g2~~TRINITY_DN26645_c1_g2_i1.p1  ORF type:complete len:936 (-),score=169.18 TRINITY_DN26645_c1_g2_i1:117-2777(-)
MAMASGRRAAVVALLVTSAALAPPPPSGDAAAAALWDFIVVGAGTGGSLCAGRLADAGASVLLLEAGHWDHWHMYDMRTASGRHNSDNVWNYPTNLPRYLSVHDSASRRHLVGSGKVMGGTSTIHGDVYDRMPLREFELGGLPSWHADRLELLAKRIERDMTLNWQGEENLDDVPDPQFWVVNKFIEGFGLPYSTRKNSRENKTSLATGWWMYRSCPSGKTCRRHSSYTDFVASRNESDAARITVLDEALVSRVIIENGEAIGVEVLRHGRSAVSAYARRAVILAAGAVGTPKVLTLSGVGDPFDLQRLGVDVHVANREVGKELADHLAHYTWFLLKGMDVDSKSKSCLERERFNIFFNLSSSKAVAAVDSEGAVEAEVRFNCGCNASRETFDFGLETVLLRPKSRGRVHVTSSNPETMPVVEFPPLWEEDHQRILVILEKLAETLGVTGEDLASEKGQSLEEHVRQGTYLYQHFCCTARAARADQPGVCDEDLRVRGVRGLYVADASALPFPPAAHTSSVVLLVAEMASEHAAANAQARDAPAAHADAAVAAARASGLGTPRETLLAKPDDLMKAPRVPTTTLRSGGPGSGGGLELPLVGLGTGSMPKQRVKGAVASFIQAGGRHLDLAVMYDNLAEVRAGVQASGLRNASEVVYTFKMMPLGFAAVQRAIAEALSALGVQRLDVALLHWPGDIANGKLLHGAPLPECAEPSHGNVSWRRCRKESYAALQAELAAGRVRAVGVSNFAVRHLDELAELGHAPPAVHQMEMQPFWYDDAALERHGRDDIALQAFGILGGAHTGGIFLRQEGFHKIGARKNATAAQVLLRWALQRGAALITGGSSEKHLRENLDLFYFELDQEDMDFINSIPPTMMRKTYGPMSDEIV